MRTSRVTTFLALAAISALPLLAEQKTPPPPAPERPIHFPTLTEQKLENGLTVVLVPLPSVPKITADLSFLAGRGTESKLHPGLAAFTARVANEGTTTRTSKELKEELRGIGGSMNITCDVDATTISTNALSESSGKLFELLADVAEHPAFPQREIALAKTNTIQEIEEARSNPDFLATMTLSKALFGSHPYGFVIAVPKQIEAITREQLKTFAGAHYLPNNAYLVVVGDIDPVTTLAQVKKAFGSWPRGTVAAMEMPALPKREKRQIYFVDRPGSVQSTIYIGDPAVARKDPDYIGMRVTNAIFGGAFYSRLTRNIREQKGYTYSPYSTFDLHRHAGSFYATASARNEVTGPTILEMLYELDRMRVLPVTDEELASSKSYNIGSMEVELETQASLAQRVDTIVIDDLPRDFLQTFRDKTAAVTIADVQKFAARHFDTYRAAIVIVGDYAKVKDQVTPFGDVKMVK